MEFSIYQSTSNNLVSVLIKFLEKVYTSGKRGLVYSSIAERIEIIDKTLWTYSTNAFIPHGGKEIPFKDQQPIYLTDVFSDISENPNHAQVLILLDVFDLRNETYKNFEKITLIFENPDNLNKVDEIYNNLKNSKENVNYWKQSKKGWEKVD